jgi:hypothetical protein
VTTHYFISFYELNLGSMFVSFIKTVLFYVRTVNKFLNKANLASCLFRIFVSLVLNECPINSNECHSSTSMFVSMPVLIGHLC